MLGSTNFSKFKDSDRLVDEQIEIVDKKDSNVLRPSEAQIEQ